MSNLIETRSAFSQVSQLLDQEIRKRSGSMRDLEKIREVLDVAFYLLGWSQFEYLVRKEFEDQVEALSSSRLVDGQAWQYMRDSAKAVPVRRRLDVIFHSKQDVRKELDEDYTLRNEAAHNYKKLPKQAKDIEQWLGNMQEIVEEMKK